MGKKYRVVDIRILDFALKMLTTTDEVELYMIEDAGCAILNQKPGLIKKSFTSPENLSVINTTV